MIKLGDLIALSYSKIAIMSCSFEILIIDANRLDMSYLSEKLLDSKIDRVESIDGYIRVWLEED